MSVMNRYRFRNATGNLTAPIGYVLVAGESGARTFRTPTNVAYGANGRFFFRTGVIGSFVFDPSSFGGDPAKGVVKGGFAEVTTENKADLDMMVNTPTEAPPVAPGALNPLAPATTTSSSTKWLIAGGLGIGALILIIVLVKVLKK